MLKKISFLIFIALIILVQSVLVNFQSGVYIAFHLCLLISVLFMIQDFSWWFIFGFGLFADLLMFRYLGFTILLFLVISLLSRSTYALFDFGGVIGKMLSMVATLFLSLCLENLLFYIFGSTSFNILFITKSFLWNIPVMIVMFGITSILKEYLLDNEKL